MCTGTAPVVTLAGRGAGAGAGSGARSGAGVEVVDGAASVSDAAGAGAERSAGAGAASGVGATAGSSAPAVAAPARMPTGSSRAAQSGDFGVRRGFECLPNVIDLVSLRVYNLGTDRTWIR
ncbi:hypothetical protein GCM10009624_15940 [Gordonia sinesedis]